MPPISGQKTGNGVQAVVLALNMLEFVAQSQRAVQSLLPRQAPGTYGRLAGVSPSTGGAGRAYLSA